jgi:hypothetical protein
MTDKPRIVLTVTAEGAVSAETRGIVGDRCLDYIAVLEDLLAARTVESTYTADYSRSTTTVHHPQEDRDVDSA